MALGSYACPAPAALVQLYRSNTLFALFIDTVAAIAVLAVAELIVLKLGKKVPRLLSSTWLFSLARGLAAAGLVVFHEYLKEGYFFKLSDLGWPPRSHESFTVYVLALSALLRKSLLQVLG